MKPVPEFQLLSSGFRVSNKSTILEIFRNVGHLIKKLKIQSFYEKNIHNENTISKFFSFIDIYESMQEISFENFLNIQKNFKMPFKNVHSLKFKNCHFTDSDEKTDWLNELFPNLEFISIELDTSYKFLENHLPNLKRMEIICYKMDTDYDINSLKYSLKLSFRLNPQLKMLNINTYQLVTAKDIEDAHKSLEGLESLHIHIACPFYGIEHNVQSYDIIQFKNLRRLEIMKKCFDKSPLPFYSEKLNEVHLSLCHSFTTHEYDFFIRHSNVPIKKLTLSFNFFENVISVEKIAKALPVLECLHLKFKMSKTIESLIPFSSEFSSLQELSIYHSNNVTDNELIPFFVNGWTFKEPIKIVDEFYEIHLKRDIKTFDNTLCSSFDSKDEIQIIIKKK